MMNRKQLIGAAAALMLMLSGCGANQAAQGNTDQTQAQEQSQQQASPETQGKEGQAQGNKRGAMNEKSFQMMRTFQSLIAMDKTDGLTITKEQAASMLPVVQESITSGELSADNQTKLLEKLTADQKKFVDEFASKAPGRMRGNGAPGDAKNGSGQTGAAGNESGSSADAANQAKESQPPMKDGSKPDGSGGQAGSEQAGKGQASGGQQGNGSGRGANIGQQLVELLQSKQG